MENEVITFSPLFLIRSFTYLQVMRTCIKAWMCLNFGQIPPLSTELAALERLKNQCFHFFSVAIDPILFKLVDNEDMHNILDEFKFRPDRTINYGLDGSKKIPIDFSWRGDIFITFSQLFFYLILFILAGNENIHKNLDKFKFRPDPITDYRVNCP